MISFVSGKIIFKGLGFIILQTDGGVGYKIFVSSSFFGARGMRGKEETKIWTHLCVRENVMDLYGFSNYAELEFFETLLKVSGVGPKSALAVFNEAPIDTIKNAIASGESAYLTRVSGIGRKTAEKIIVELRDKLGGKDGAVFQFKEDEEVFEALKGLGYATRDIRETLNKLPPETAGAKNRLKESLKLLGKA